MGRKRKVKKGVWNQRRTEKAEIQDSNRARLQDSAVSYYQEIKLAEPEELDMLTRKARGKRGGNTRVTSRPMHLVSGTHTEDRGKEQSKKAVTKPAYRHKVLRRRNKFLSVNKRINTNVAVATDGGIVRPVPHKIRKITKLRPWRNRYDNPHDQFEMKYRDWSPDMKYQVKGDTKQVLLVNRGGIMRERL